MGAMLMNVLWHRYQLSSSVYIQNRQSAQRFLARAGCGTRTRASCGSFVMFLLWQTKQGPLSRIVGENKTAEGEQDAVVCLYVSAGASLG
jgi:hypothetical protein